MFDSREEHVCDECGIFIGDIFADENGKVINRYKYSHILPKKRYPQFRHKLYNFNYLCLVHHMQWEDKEKRKSMKIYIPNLTIIHNLLNGKEEGI